jgi:fructosamine-3-kinase
LSASDRLTAALEEALGERIRSIRPVAGGSISDAFQVELASGGRAFLKSRAGAEPAEFAAEAAGLRWLAGANAVRSPRVLATGARPAWIALEWIPPGTLSAAGAEALGRDLAALHAAGAPAHGGLPPDSPDAVLRIGSVALEVQAEPEWPAFYAHRCLLPLVRAASDAGTLAGGDREAIEAVCARIADLAGPAEPPARLHGDLWTGNVLADSSGDAWLIDPAAYGGHREIDLAMLRLFGAPPERVFAAYEEAHPLGAGHGERVGLWQLLPLLVHAVLFGAGYGASAGETARRYL